MDSISFPFSSYFAFQFILFHRKSQKIKLFVLSLQRSSPKEMPSKGKQKQRSLISFREDDDIFLHTFHGLMFHQRCWLEHKCDFPIKKDYRV